MVGLSVTGVCADCFTAIEDAAKYASQYYIPLPTSASSPWLQYLSFLLAWVIGIIALRISLATIEFAVNYLRTVLFKTNGVHDAVTSGGRSECSSYGSSLGSWSELFHDDCATTESSADSYTTFSQDNDIASVITIDSEKASIISGITTFSSMFWGRKKSHSVNELKKRDEEEGSCDTSGVSSETSLLFLWATGMTAENSKTCKTTVSNPALLRDAGPDDTKVVKFGKQTKAFRPTAHKTSWRKRTVVPLAQVE